MCPNARSSLHTPHGRSVCTVSLKVLGLQEAGHKHEKKLEVFRTGPPRPRAGTTPTTQRNQAFAVKFNTFAINLSTAYYLSVFALISPFFPCAEIREKGGDINDFPNPKRQPQRWELNSQHRGQTAKLPWPQFAKPATTSCSGLIARQLMMSKYHWNLAQDQIIQRIGRVRCGPRRG